MSWMSCLYHWTTFHIIVLSFTGCVVFSWGQNLALNKPAYESSTAPYVASPGPHKAVGKQRNFCLPLKFNLRHPDSGAFLFVCLCTRSRWKHQQWILARILHSHVWTAWVLVVGGSGREVRGQQGQDHQQRRLLLWVDLIFFFQT